MTMRVMCHCKMRATCLGGRGPYKIYLKIVFISKGIYRRKSRRWGEGREWKKGGHIGKPFCKFRWVTGSSKWKREAWVDLCTLGFTFDISLSPRHLNQKQTHCIWIFSSLSLCSISSIRLTFFFHYGAGHIIICTLKSVGPCFLAL